MRQASFRYTSQLPSYPNTIMVTVMLANNETGVIQVHVTAPFLPQYHHGDCDAGKQRDRRHSGTHHNSLLNNPNTIMVTVMLANNETGVIQVHVTTPFLPQHHHGDCDVSKQRDRRHSGTHHSSFLTPTPSW